MTAAVVAKKHNVDADPPAFKVVSKKAMTKIKKKIEQQYYDEMIGKGEFGAIDIKLEVKDGVTYKKIPGCPYFNTVKGMDVFINGLMKDKLVGKKAMELLETYRDKPFFLFVHFAEIDHKGHGHGEGSKKQHEAYISVDLWTGKIMKKLEDLGLYDDTLVYVTSDHGFDKGIRRHKDAPCVFLATNDPNVMRRGERADIAPTILEQFGVDLDKIDPPLDGHTLTKPYKPPMW